MAFGEVGIADALKVNEGSDATGITPDNGRVQISALSQANKPNGINGLANEAMMGGVSTTRCPINN
jgi:hypothetical protein